MQEYQRNPNFNKNPKKKKRNKQIKVNKIKWLNKYNKKIRVHWLISYERLKKLIKTKQTKRNIRCKVDRKKMVFKFIEIDIWSTLCFIPSKIDNPNLRHSTWDKSNP